MRRATIALAALAGLLVFWLGPAGADIGDSPKALKLEQVATPSGAYEFKDVVLGTNITECPQAGMNTEPDPVDRRVKDDVEKISDHGDDTRANTEYSCFPQNETSIAVNPTSSRNIVSGANDYRLGWASSGFYASSDGGKHWYDGLIPFPSLPNGDNLDGGGDPALVVRPRRSRLLRGHQLQPHRRHQRRVREPLDERRLHVEPSVRGRLTATRSGSRRPALNPVTARWPSRRRTRRRLRSGAPPTSA